MALKDINFKQLVLEKGERVGLAAAAVIALVLVLTLFIPGMGFLSGSASGNADVLTKAADGVEKGLRDNTPSDADKPEDPTNKLVAFNFTIIDPNAAKGYGIAGLFQPLRGGSAGRQMPTLYLPNESQVALVRLQLPALVFDNKFEYLETLKGAPTTGGPGAPAAGSMAASAGSTGAALNKMPSSYNPQTALKSSPYAQMLAKRGLYGDRGAANAEKAEKDYDTEWVAISKMDKNLGGVQLAEQAYPLRTAEIAAAFPYKDQLREFREKLRLSSDAAVLSEMSLETSKDGRPMNAFRFLGVTIQRRQLDAQGKPVGGGDKEGWAPLDLDGTYKPLVILDGKRFEDEDPKLRPVILPGLVMKKLVTLGSRRTPALDEYPKVEDQLPSLAATVEALNKRPDAIIGKSALTDAGNVFADDQSLQQTGPNGMTPPGFTPPAGSGPAGVGSSGPAGSGPASFGPEGLKPGQELAIPDACLIRLFDVTVEPGKTYEYRMQVRMANPNYHRTDAASQGYADEPELPTKSWYVLPQKLTVPPDLYYYAVDQKELDARDKDKEPRLPMQLLKDNQTVMQIHRWVDYLHTKSRTDLPIGDWVIAERAVVMRGEPVGPQRVEVPYWRTTQDKFVMASDLPPKPPPALAKYPPSVEVPFAPEGDVPIVVDFAGGDVTYRRTHPRTDDAAAADQPPVIQDKAPLQVVLMTSDGKLLAHNAANDAPDPERVQRLKDVREWIQNVKNNKSGGPANTDLFGK